MIGRTISHYEIVRKVGQGGMGVVYEARDLRLPRSLALKFLPTHVSADRTAKKRLVNEARAISALDHPNISTIHDIDEDPESGLFIVMPLYRGVTVEDLVAEGPMELTRAMDIVRQVGSGLAAVHEKGVIHLDIKPSNIFVTDDGLVKILDFGIAKSSMATHVTREGATLGTVAYMSPEQAQGNDVDKRSDIWSTAVVFYELLAGTVPFRGGTDAAVIAAILTREPDDLGTSRPDVPAETRRVIAKALRKRRSDRYQNMWDFLHDLESAEHSTSGNSFNAAVPDLSIVVCPFEDISPNRDNTYFSDGLTEEIITDLSQVRKLRVISQSSSSLLKGTDKDTKTISRELGVRYLLRGSVRKAGNRLRISAQCIDAYRDTNVWADKYSGTLDNVFDIQESVSRSIVHALALELTPHESMRVSKRHIDDVYAYEFYLKARHELYLWSEEGLDRAVRNLQDGLDLVGENALLYAGMAHAHWQYVNAGFKPADHLSVAKDYVDKVLALEPDSPHGHRLNGLIAYRDDLQTSARHFKRALAANPNDPDSLFWLITVYFFAGQTDAARPLVRALLKIDPLNPLSRSAPGWLDFFDGRFEPAIEVIGKVYAADPTNPAYQFLYIQMLVYNGSFDGACEHIDRLVLESPQHPLAMMGSLLKHAIGGDATALGESLTPALSEMLGTDAHYAWFVATCFALVRRADAAVSWLTKAVDLGFINYPFFSRHDRLLDNVREDAAFQALIERIRREWEGFEP